MTRILGPCSSAPVRWQVGYPGIAFVVRGSEWRLGIRTLFLSTMLLPLLASCTAHASSRTKLDVVYMRNGDKITGEIESLSQGQLSIKPEYTTTAFILDWRKVDHIESSQGFVVTDPTGAISSGSISSSGPDRTLTVHDVEEVKLPLDHVIEMDELGKTFLKRLRGDFDLGLSFARSNQQKNLTFQSDLGYQSKEHLFSLNSTSQWTSQKETSDTNESSLKAAFYQQLQDSNWYAGVLTNFLSSSEQQIDLRSTIGGGIAKRLIFTNRTNLDAMGGLAFTVERDSADSVSTARTKAIDSVFALQYSAFRFDAATFDTSFWLYPSLTSPGRVRMTLNQDIYYKFYSDFYVRFSLYDNFDNQPVVGAPKNNIGASTTLGWSFH